MPALAGDSDSKICHAVQAWVLIDAQLYGVPLRVPRTFFVDSDLEPSAAAAAMAWPGAIVSRVKRTPPKGSAPRHLYKVCVA
jgi:hypothetical protein